MWYLTSLYVVLLLLAITTTTFCTRCSINQTIHAHTHTAQGCPKIHFSLSLSQLGNEVMHSELTSIFLMCWCIAACRIHVWPLLREYIRQRKRYLSLWRVGLHRTIHVHAYTAQGYPKMQFSSVIHPPIPATVLLSIRHSLPSSFPPSHPLLLSHSCRMRSCTMSSHRYPW